MRSAAYSIFTTILLLAPISAVPLMAIFGVPQFAPVVASPLDETEDADDDWDHPPRKSSRTKSTDNRLADDELDLFEDDALDWGEPKRNHHPPVKKPRPRFRSEAPDEEVADDSFDDRPSRSKSKSVAPSGKPRRPLPMVNETDDVVLFASSESTVETPAEVENADFEREAEAAPRKSTPKPTGDIPSYRRSRLGRGEESERPSDKPFRRAPPPEEPLTWGKAVDRLNELGIRNFRLEPGVQPGEFTFTCSYTPTNSPHVTRRFEAEADDPLKAVAQVLVQVERWAQQREPAASKRTAEVSREIN